jgi:hypothetical protein
MITHNFALMEHLHSIKDLGFLFLHQVHLSKASLPNQPVNNKAIRTNNIGLLLLWRRSLANEQNGKMLNTSSGSLSAF